VQILLDGAARASKEPEGMAPVRLRLSERDAPSLKQRWYACPMFDDQDGA